MSGSYKLGDSEFHSRLIIGSGKYASLEENRKALDASGAEMVTVSLRRIDRSVRVHRDDHVAPGLAHPD